jgi:transposase-like protein
VAGAFAEYEKARLVRKLRGARDRASERLGRRVEGRKGYREMNPGLVREAKRRTGPMLGFESFRTARRTLAGVEAMAMLAKGQVRAAPADDISAQWIFVHQVFGLAA